MQTQMEAVRVAYRLLVDESKVPVDARRVSEAALSPTRDSDGPWAIVRAMARAVDDPHTTLIAAGAGPQVQALVLGRDSTHPGFTLHRSHGRFVVGEVTGANAHLAGVKVGDDIVSIDGQPVRAGFEDLVELMSKPEGTLIVLGAVRGGTPLDLTMPVRPSPPSVVDSRLLAPRIGYVRLRFVTTSEDPERDAAALVSRAVSALGGQDLLGLVLDLRANPGGYGVARVTSVLTDRTPLALYRDVNGVEEAAPRTDANPACRCPIVVLVDDQTLSAAEMIALALQDHGVARVVGQPTAGGLTVPRYVPLGEGYVLMTPERFALGPSTRRAPEGRRVQPNVLVANRTPMDFVTGKDAQLEQALELLTQ